MELKILGPFEITVASKPLGISAPKEQALLALLALEAPRTVPADKLVDELWPDLAPERGHATLQVRISALRKILRAAGAGDAIRTRPPGYVLQMGSDGLDASRFEALAAAGRGRLDSGDPATAGNVLREALALWRGPALAGLDRSIVLQAEAARLEERRTATLEDRIEADLACGRHDEVVGELEVLTGEHPLRERAWGQRMVALYRCGREAEALRAYQKLRRVLADEVGLAPSASLRVLEQRILDQDPNLAHPDRASSAGGLGGGQLPAVLAAARGWGRFVDRIAERRALLDAWGRAVDGRAIALAWIGGEPGVGKTRLIAETAAAIAGEGATVMFGRCDEEPLVPYQPFVEALGAHLGSLGDGDLGLLPGRDLGLLSRLVPQLAARLPGLQLEPIEDPAVERLLTFEAVASIIAALAIRHPVLVVLDDLHWADRASLLLLGHLARAGISAPTLVLGTYRSEEVGHGTPLGDLLADLRRHDVDGERVLLRGLSAADVGELLESASPAGSSEALAQALYHATEGNPFFLREVLRHLAETGNVSAGRALAVPEAVKEVIGRRLVRLTEDAGDLIRVAAVAGREFDLGLVGPVCGRGEQELLGALDDLLRARLVVEVPDIVDRFSFAHALVRETLLDQLGTSRRTRLHRRLGEALESAAEGGSGRQVAALAYHFVAAGPTVDACKAIGYASQAGQEAAAHLAYDEAVRWHEAALEVLDARGPQADVRRCELLLALGEAQLVGDQRRGRATLLLAAEAAESDGAGDIMAKAVLACAQEAVGLGVIDEVIIGLLERALDALEPGDGRLRTRALGRLGYELFFLEGSRERGKTVAEDAVEMGRRLGDPGTLAAVMIDRRFYQNGAEQIDEWLADATTIVQLSEQAGDRVMAWQGRMYRSGALLVLGDVRAARAELELLSADAAELRRPRMLWWTTMASASHAFLRGEVDEGERLSGQALQIGLRAGDPGAVAFSYHGGQLFVAMWMRGALDEYVPMVEKYVALYPSVTIAKALLLFAQANTGRHSVAGAELDRLAAGDFAAIPHDTNWLSSMALLAEVASSVGTEAQAARIYELLTPYSRLNVDNGTSMACLGPMARYLGLLAARLGRRHTATDHFQSALSMAEDMSAPFFIALARQGLDRSDR